MYSRKDCALLVVRHIFDISSFILYKYNLKIFLFFFFFNDTAPPEIYTLSLHDALPISRWGRGGRSRRDTREPCHSTRAAPRDRKSTRLNSSHGSISYAVFCLKKKRKKAKYVLIEKKQKKNHTK